MTKGGIEMYSDIEQLQNEKKQLINEIKSLNENPIIKKKEDLKKQAYKIDSQIRKMQKECQHSIWHYIKKEKDHFEGRVYFTCRCLECDKIEERRGQDFKRLLSKNE